MFFRGVACCCYHTPGKRKKGRLCMKRPQNDMKCNLTLKGRPSGQTFPPSQRSCKVRHTAPQWHRYYPRTVSHASETLRSQGAERRTLPLLSLGRVCSRRKQRACGAAMRLCASLSRRRRGPAGLRDPFSSVGIVACMPCAQGLSACARRGCYHYPRSALRAAETLDGRLSKRLICRFLRSGGHH